MANSTSSAANKTNPFGAPTTGSGITTTGNGSYSPLGSFNQTPAIPQKNLDALSVPPSNTSATSPAKTQFINSLATPQNPAQPTPTPQTPGAGSPITGNTQTPSGATVNAGTGALVAPPAADPNANYRSAFDSYLQSLQPSTAETEGSKYLADLTLQSKKDYEDALNRPGETMGFATGEAARVNRNNAFGIEAASNSLNALTGARTAQTGATKARLDFEQSIRGKQEPSIEKVGNDIVRIAPDGTATKIYTGTPEQKTQIVQAGGRSVLVDQNTGKVIADLGASEASLTRAAAADKAATTASTAAASANSEASGAVDLIDSILGGNYQALTGIPGPTAFLPGTQAQYTKNQINELKGMLSLENRAKLKGSGAISDFEAKTLGQAASALGTNLSDTDFAAELGKIRGVFAKKAGLPSTSSGDQSQSYQLPNGTVVHLQADGTYQ